MSGASVFISDVQARMGIRIDVFRQILLFCKLSSFRKAHMGRNSTVPRIFEADTKG